jgi:small subunit ribosomal protein S9
MVKPVVTAGTRKRAVARASLKDGKGVITMNGRLVDSVQPEILRLKILTPILLAGDVSKKVDIRVNVRGGGFNSQAEAATTAIAKALARHDKKLERVFLDYDRRLLVSDVRRKEVRKPNRHGKARAKVQKSYR